MSAVLSVFDPPSTTRNTCASFLIRVIWCQPLKPLAVGSEAVEAGYTETESFPGLLSTDKARAGEPSETFLKEIVDFPPPRCFNQIFAVKGPVKTRRVDNPPPSLKS